MANNNNISDELLAAFLDGNTNEAETLEVLNALNKDPELQATLDIALQVEDDSSFFTLHPSFSENALPMLRLAAESGKNICSVLCEAYILQRRGIPFEEKELLSLAEKNDWLKPEGTPLHVMGQLLVHYGLMIMHKYDATLDDIGKALSADNDIIVVVDSDKLYSDFEDKEDAPNHAVVVTAIDEKADTVRIYDPQYNMQETIAGSQLERAWHESKNYMIRVLRSIDEYNPQPINLDNIPLDDDLMNLREAIAENAHDVWAEARIKEGWSYGEERDDVNKKHPDLIPYSALPDSEKEYDRLMAFNTIKLVRKLGYKIIKQ